MGNKKIKASNERYEYSRDTSQNQVVYSTTLGAATVTKITSHVTIMAINMGIPLSATARQIQFNSLDGNIPYFGVVTIGTEQIRYASVTWISAVAGYLNECTRGFNGTVAAIHIDTSVISHTNLLTYRNKFTIYNYTGGNLFVGPNANITGGINSQIIANNDSFTFNISPVVDMWVLSSGGGAIAIVEYV